MGGEGGGKEKRDEEGPRGKTVAQWPDNGVDNMMDIGRLGEHPAFHKHAPNELSESNGCCL